MLQNGNKCGKTKVMRISRKPFPLQIMIGQKQLENVEYFKCLGSMVTNDVTCTRKIKSSIATAKSSIQQEEISFPSKLD